MTWSIFKDSTRPYKEWEPCYTAWFIDEDMDTNYFPNKIKFLHDGYVDVYFEGNYVTCKVVGGEWARETERQILGMVSLTYHGTFIERFYRAGGKIHVVMGS